MISSTANRPISDRSLLRVAFWTALIISSLAAIHLAVFGIEEDSFRVIIWGTARISAVLFALAFSASSIHYFVKSSLSARLLKHRPQLGLAFTVSHTLHLISLLYLQSEIHPVFTLAKMSSLFAGSVAFLLMYLMAITSFSEIKSRLTNRSWRLLHLIGGYWIWAIFFNSYLKNVLNRDKYYVLLALMTLVLILRLAHLVYRKRSHL